MTPTEQPRTLDHHHPPAAQQAATVWTTAIAAALNMLIILMLLVIVGPKMDAAGRANDENLAAITKNREMLAEARREIQQLINETAYYRKSIDRLNAAMDANEARARKAAEDAMRKGKGGGGGEEAPQCDEAPEPVPPPRVVKDWQNLIDEARVWLRLFAGVRFVFGWPDGWGDE